MNKNSNIMAFSVLSLSLLPMATGATSATIPGVMHQFPAVSAETAELTVTIPSFAVAVMIIISSFLVKRIGTKKMVIGGMLLTTVGAVISMLSPTITVLLIGRLLLGLGIGMFNTLCISLIDLLYQGARRERLLGFQNTFQGLGAAGGALAVSIILMVANWRLAFAIYLIALPILILYVFAVPEVRYDQETVPDSKQVGLGVSALGKFAYYWLVLFIAMDFYMTTNIKITSYILDHHLGSLAIGSGAVVLISVGTIIGGLIYGTIYHFLKRITLFVALVVEALSVILIAFATNGISATVGAFGVGFAFGLFLPYIFSVGLMIVPKKFSNDATMVLMLSTNGANFLCPYIGKWLNGGRTAQSLFLVAGLIIFVTATIELGQVLITRRNLHLSKSQI